MRLRPALVGVALGVLAAPLALHSQEDPAPLREGFFFSLGVGAASVSASCEGCSDEFFEDRVTGFSGNLLLGGSVTDRLVIAGEFSGWMANEPPVLRRTASLSVVFISYFRPDGRFSVRTGVGAIRAIGENDFVVVQTDALQIQGGLGYDFALGQNSLTAYANYRWSPTGSTWVNDVTSPTTVLPDAFQVGLAYTVF